MFKAQAEKKEKEPSPGTHPNCNIYSSRYLGGFLVVFTNQSQSKRKKKWLKITPHYCSWVYGQLDGCAGLVWAHSRACGQLDVGEVALLIFAGLRHMPGS